VLGTVLAALLVRTLGFSATALVATLIYAVTASVWVLAMWRGPKGSSGELGAPE
jgi:hypothetical protein